MNQFEYFSPHSLDEALELVADKGEDAKVLAGGTGLINMMKQRLVNPDALIDLGRLGGLSDIRFDNGSVKIGALVNHQTLVDSSDIQNRVPLLAETYRHVATVRIRNFATVGGGLAHGDPNQDPQVSLLALGASVQLASRGGSRSLPLEDFLVDYYETAIKPDEVLTELTVPVPAAGTGAAYLKFLPRTADDYATVSAAAVVRVENGVIADARVAFGSAAPTAMRVAAAETMLKGQKPSEDAFRAAAETARPLCDPVSDARGSASYKTDMVPVFIRRALMQAAQRAGAAV